MPSLRAAHGILSLLISCHASPPDGNCQATGPSNVATLSNSLLQVGQGRQVISSVAEEDDAGAEEQQAQQASSSAARATPQTSTCSSACKYEKETHACEARVVWSLNTGRERNLTGALKRVNRECDGQCQCSLADFAGVWISQPEPEPEDDVGECHTAVEGERCFTGVEWARSHGIRLDAARYEGLTSGSTFEEFQEFLHEHRVDDCPRPCNLCHTAQPAEICYAAVKEALAREEYAQVMTFEMVQAMLNRTDSNSSCPMPCNICHTAQPGETCFKGVRWAMQHGIRIHPDHYPGLSAVSTFEDFQIALHQRNLERCAMPCVLAVPASTSTMASAETSVATASVTESSTITTTPKDSSAMPTMETTIQTTSSTETSTTMPDLQPVPPIEMSTTMPDLQPVPPIEMSTMMPDVQTLVETSATPTTPASDTTASANMTDSTSPSSLSGMTTVIMTTSSANVQSPEATVNFDSLNVSLKVTLNELNDVARIRVSGPPDVWFGVAFDASSMSDLPYSIIVDGTGDETGEWKLGMYTKGEKLDDSLQQVSAAVMDGMRFVEFERSLLGLTDSHFTFDPLSTTLNVLVAIGSTGVYGYHAAADVGQLEFAV